MSSLIERVHGLDVVAHTGLLGYCTVKGPMLLCLKTKTHTSAIWLIFSLLWLELFKKEKALYLSHGSLSNLVWMLSNALQEVFEVWHGDVFDLLSQSGQIFSHDLTEPVLTDPARDTSELWKKKSSPIQHSFKKINKEIHFKKQCSATAGRLTVWHLLASHVEPTLLWHSFSSLRLILPWDIDLLQLLHGF